MQILLFHLGGRHVHCKNTTFVTVFDGTIQKKIINVFYQFERVKKLNYSLQMNLGFWEGNPLTHITPFFLEDRTTTDPQQIVDTPLSLEVKSNLLYSVKCAVLR